YHPRFGEVVQIRRRLASGGIEFVVVLQPDGSFACLPAWMIEPAASRFEIGDEAHFPLQILRSMRAEVDALLGFLRSESKTETADNDAQIRKSPTKSVRREGAGRGAVRGSEGRARRPRGGTAPRDRKDAGRLLRRGDIKGRQVCPGAPWVIRAADLAGFATNKGTKAPLTPNAAQPAF